MIGFYFANGKQGSGKTLLIVKHLVVKYINDLNKKVFLYNI